MKKTPLHQWHIDNGANMAEFGSYSMPLWYPKGAKQEHLGVITGAGLFDTSHMAAILVKNSGARQLLQKTFSKDLDHCIGLKQLPLNEGRCVYGVFLRPDGHVIDDAIIYQVTEELFMIVVNAGMGSAITEHLNNHKDDVNVELVDLTDTLGKIDCQGPSSAKILYSLLQNPSEVFSRLGYFSFKGWFEKGDVSPVVLLDGTPILLSRTGYTGEFGFEIFLAAEHLQKVWTKILEAGGDDLIPCGLAARDSLRAGAVLPLSHQDIGEWIFAENPWMFALPLDSEGNFTKSFVGSDALLSGTDDEYTYAFAGFDLRKITISDTAAVLDEQGGVLGTILTCATDMAIGRVDDQIISLATKESDGRPADFRPKGLCCGFIKVNSKLEYGSIVYLSDGKRKIKVEIRKDIRPDRTARCPIDQMT